MNMLRLVVLIGLANLAAPLSAHAEYEPAPCRWIWHDQGAVGRGWWAEAEKLDRCQRASMNIVPIERRAARGEEVYRMFYNAGERAIPLFVEFVRESSGRARLSLRTLFDRKPVLQIAVSASRWDAIAERWTKRPRLQPMAMPSVPTDRGADHGVETVCISAGDADIEVARSGSIVRTQVESCDGAGMAFVDFLLAEAARDVGACARDASDAYSGLRQCLPPRPARRR